MLKAFRDTWELGLHSYLTYLRDRLLLAKELLSEQGSLFVQISDENLHHVKEIISEVFGSDNFFALITLQKTSPLGASGLPGVCDYIIWYAKDIKNSKYRNLYTKKIIGGVGGTGFTLVEDNGVLRKITEQDITDFNQGKNVRFASRSELISSGLTPSCVFEIEFNGRNYWPTANRSWRTNKEGIEKLIEKNRIIASGNKLYYKQYYDDFPYMTINNLWTDVQSSFAERVYVVQTLPKIIERCMIMCSDPGDVVLDITCGSGTTAFVAEQWGRRWITCDTSRIALTLAKQRLMTATFDFYELAFPSDGVDSGFKYKSVPHVTLKSIAKNEPTDQEVLYDQPISESKKIRVAGPFTVEAVPAPTVLSLEDTLLNEADVQSADKSIVRKGETKRQDDWRSELLRTGVRAKGGNKIEFSRVEPIQGTTYLQAEAETKEANPKKVLVCFGPEHAPLEQRLVELALEEAGNTKPKPDMVLFCAFQFDEEASKDIDETNWPGVTLLKAQMNMDLQTDDLKKGNRSSESFWLIGQPDIELKKVGDGKVQVSVNGFDYYNPKTSEVESGGKDKIAMWMLDHNYDGRSLLPSQVFLPLSGAKEGWSTLAKNLKAEIDEDKMESYSGTVSLPFVPGKQVAVKIIDDRGIESLKIIRL